MDPRFDVFVSVVAPLRNHAEIIEEFLAELYNLLDSHYSNFEIVLVDDASTDDTVSRVKECLATFKCIRLIPLSRPMGDEIAITAGLESAIGDFVVTMDPNFDPVSEILPMVELCRDGSDVVVGITEKSKGRGFFYRVFREVFYKIGQWLIRAPLVRGVTRFRALSRQAVNAFTRVKSRRRYFVILASDIGYGCVTYPYTRISRSGQKPDIGTLEAIHMGLSIIIHNSNRPLRFVSVLGLLGAFLSFSYALYVVIIYLIRQDVMPGWTTLSLQSSGLFLLVFIMLTLLGEYVGRIVEEASDRPLYHLRSELTSSVMIANELQRNVLEQSVGDSIPVGPPTISPQTAEASNTEEKG